jgi:hypothetical protein
MYSWRFISAYLKLKYLCPHVVFAIIAVTLMKIDTSRAVMEHSCDSDMYQLDAKCLVNKPKYDTMSGVCPRILITNWLGNRGQHLSWRHLRGKLLAANRYMNSSFRIWVIARFDLIIQIRVHEHSFKPCCVSYLPLQGSSIQTSSSVALPLQSRPRYCGTGSEQRRWRVLVPLSQATEQLVQGLHETQEPWTVKKKSSFLALANFSNEESYLSTSLIDKLSLRIKAQLNVHPRTDCAQRCLTSTPESANLKEILYVRWAISCHIPGLQCKRYPPV